MPEPATTAVNATLPAALIVGIRKGEELTPNPGTLAKSTPATRFGPKPAVVPGVPDKATVP
jgi:hypothetical protein